MFLIGVMFTCCSFVDFGLRLNDTIFVVIVFYFVSFCVCYYRLCVCGYALDLLFVFWCGLLDCCLIVVFDCFVDALLLFCILNYWFAVTVGCADECLFCFNLCCIDYMCVFSVCNRGMLLFILEDFGQVCFVMLHGIRGVYVSGLEIVVLLVGC